MVSYLNSSCANIQLQPLLFVLGAALCYALSNLSLTDIYIVWKGRIVGK
jgi:hypothetical protein